MLLYRGGQQVTGGTYWSMKDGGRIDGRQEHLLPGDGKRRYVRVHPVIMFLLAPLLGLAYFLTLPFMAILLTLFGAARRAAQILSGTVSTLAYFEWKPNEAYLAGSRKRPGRAKADEKDSQDGGHHRRSE